MVKNCMAFWRISRQSFFLSAVAPRRRSCFAAGRTGALDSKTGEQVLELLSRVSKTYHTTVVIITHNASIAPLGDRVIRMRNGTIVENTVNPHPARVEDIAW